MSYRTHLREWFRHLADALEVREPAPERYRARIKMVERDTVLPVKLIFVVILTRALAGVKWFGNPSTMLDVAIEFVVQMFWVYVGTNVLLTIPLLLSGRLPVRVLQYVVFGVCLVDALFVSALALVTGGYDSLLFWILVGLMIRNTVSLPPVVPQLVANAFVIAMYTLTGLLDIEITVATAERYDEATQEALGLVLPTTLADTLLLRVVVLALTAVSGFLVQVLTERQRIAMEEAREFAARQAELKTASTIAARIAHRIKNPLAIINNAAFMLEKAMAERKGDPVQYLQLIRDEVARADRVITELVGYAKLADGHVRKLDVAQEIRHAVAQVFNPPDAHPVTIKVEVVPELPNIMMLGEHVSDILCNLLANARDAAPAGSAITIRAHMLDQNRLLIQVRDQGPGVPPDKTEQIFEPYYTTKPHGSGLGLAIVKSTVELYGGRVWVENAPDGGAVFNVVLPVKVLAEPLAGSAGVA